MYAIIKGSCNLVCLQNNEKYMSIAISEDPTQLKRYKEQKLKSNPNIPARVLEKFGRKE